MKSTKLVSKYYQLMLHQRNLKNAWETIYNHMKLFKKLLNNILRSQSLHEYIQADLYSFINSINYSKLYLTT
jgi:hypothetical protein